MQNYIKYHIKNKPMIGMQDLLLTNIVSLLEIAKKFDNRYKSRGISLMLIIEQLSELINNLQNKDPIDETVFSRIDMFAEILFDKSFQFLHFKERDYGDNLRKLFGIAQEIAKIDPEGLATQFSALYLLQFNSDL